MKILFIITASIAIKKCNEIFKDLNSKKILIDCIVTENAKKRDTPVVSIPHGLYIYLSTDPTGGGNNKFRLAENKRINNNMNFDWYVVQNRIKEKHILDCGIKVEEAV